jgi:hypothetical protein
MSLRLAACLLLAFALAGAPAARASGIEIGKISIEAADDGYTLNADFEIALNSNLEDAISKGVALYFVVDFELTRKRWYWFDEKGASRALTLRLGYHALTRQYRVSSGALHQSFPTLADALRVLSRVRSWHVLDRGDVGAGSDYQAALRVRLDVTQLPKPFQVNALTSREWNLASDWQRWPFKASAPVTERTVLPPPVPPQPERSTPALQPPPSQAPEKPPAAPQERPAQ